MKLQRISYLIFISQIVLLQSVELGINKRTPTSKTVNINILRVTASIIQNCFNDKSKSIVLSGDWGNENVILIHQTFASSIPIKLTKLYEIVNNNPREVKKEANYYIFILPTHNSVLFALQTLRNSLLWNYKGFFLVVDSNVKGNCRAAKDILHLVWSFNILSAVILCNLDEKLQLYTFNPFNQFAPTFWNAVKNNESQKKPIWTLFKHTLTDTYFLPLTNSSWCKNLDFNKMSNLGGYKVKIGYGFTEHSRVLYAENRKGLDKFLGYTGALHHTIWSYLNVTVKVVLYDKLCLRDENSDFCDIFKDLINSKLDCIMNPIFTNTQWNHWTYPIKFSGLCVIASMNEYTAIDKFILTFTPKFWLIIFFSSVMSALILKYVLNQTIARSFLEIVQMLLCMSSLRPPNDLFRRIFFAVLLFLSLILNSYFQSRLSATHIVPNLDSTIDSLGDLIRSNIPVYGKKDFKDYFQYSRVLRQYQIEENYTNCIDLLRSGEKISCIVSSSMRFKLQESARTHVGKHMIRELFQAICVRDSWPILLRFNKVLQKMHESGLLKLFRDRENKLLLARVPTVREKSQNLSFKNLIIAFCAYIIGLTIATLMFFMEAIIYKIIKYNQKRFLRIINN